MKARLFKLILGSSLAVALVGLIVLATWLCAATELTILEVFTPALVIVILVILLSLLLAKVISSDVVRPLGRIDVGKPDERDVEDEIKPLIRRLNDQNRQIRSQMDELAREHDRQDQMRREFTANVSHELKTPLTSISGFAELMKDNLVRPEDVPRFSGKIYDEAQRLIVLVGDILRLSRLEEQRTELLREPVNLRETARKVLDQLQSVAQKQQITLELQGEEGIIQSVPRVVEEILYNLLDNGIKYNRAGGRVTVCIAEGEADTQVRIEDTGIGIAEADLPRIYERFYRVDKSHSREVGGTGLGLSIVKHGAAALGAEIRMESTLGVGTTITLRFPG